MDLARDALALLVDAAVALGGGEPVLGGPQLVDRPARLSASPTIRLMKSPSESDRPIEIVPEMRTSVRVPAAKSLCAHRTRENATTTSTVPIAAHRVGTIAHSWGNSVK